jgi:hypothetical protein
MELEEDLDIVELPTFEKVQDSLKALRNKKTTRSRQLTC